MTDSPTFIHQFPLIVDIRQEKRINLRFNYLRIIHNGVLSECFKREKQLKQTKAYRHSIECYKSQDKKKLAEAKKTLRALNKVYGLSEYPLHAFSKTMVQKMGVKCHLDSHTIQTITTRAWKSFESYLYKQKGKPRFKAKSQGLKSVSGKQHTCVTFKDGQVHWLKSKYRVKYDKQDKHGVQAHALNSDIKYCRIVRKTTKGRYRYYVQLVLKGKPLIKPNHIIKKGDVGLDIGPSTIACVSENGHAFLDLFCRELDNNETELKQIQRQMRKLLTLLHFLFSLKPYDKQ